MSAATEVPTYGTLLRWRDGNPPPRPLWESCVYVWEQVQGGKRGEVNATNEGNIVLYLVLTEADWTRCPYLTGNSEIWITLRGGGN